MRSTSIIRFRKQIQEDLDSLKHYKLALHRSTERTTFIPFKNERDSLGRLLANDTLKLIYMNNTSSSPLRSKDSPIRPVRRLKSRDVVTPRKSDPLLHTTRFGFKNDSRSPLGYRAPSAKTFTPSPSRPRTRNSVRKLVRKRSLEKYDYLRPEVRDAEDTRTNFQAVRVLGAPVEISKQLDFTTLKHNKEDIVARIRKTIAKNAEMKAAQDN